MSQEKKPAKEIFKRLKEQYPGAVKSGAIQLLDLRRDEDRPLGRFRVAVKNMLNHVFFHSSKNPTAALFEHLKKQHPGAVKSGAIQLIKGRNVSLEELGGKSRKDNSPKP